MIAPFIIDAHAHVGLLGRLPCPQVSVAARIEVMDRLDIQLTICSDQEALAEGGRTGLAAVQEAYDESDGRIHGLAVLDPRSPDRCLGELRDALKWPGLRGIKIHPSMHRTAADHPAYAAVWEFAAAHDLPILAHTWSVSPHNPAQALSTPERFESFVRQFPAVRFVLGHAGGRGAIDYAAAKAGLHGMMVYLNRNHARKGVLTNLVHPCVIETELFRERYNTEDQRAELASTVPVGRLGMPSDIADLVAFLASPFGDFICGQAILVDGGRTFFK